MHNNISKMANFAGLAAELGRAVLPKEHRQLVQIPVPDLCIVLVVEVFDFRPQKIKVLLR